jgi:heptosyltransferase III
MSGENRGISRIKQREEKDAMVFRYRLNKKFRDVASWLTGLVTMRSPDEPFTYDREKIRKILLVRATFRMGDSILATPAILLFRNNFPNAKIDFVGPDISKQLFANLPIDQHYEIHQRLPRSAWAYVPLLREIRNCAYDIAIDVSCSKSALGAFIVGFSGARFRIGLRGRRDQWYNVRLPRPSEMNKYRNLPLLVESLGLKTSEVMPSIILTAAEKENGRRRVRKLVGSGNRSGPVVGIFVGGRKSWGKRWPERNFKDLAAELYSEGAAVIVFIGPEEKDVRRYFEESLPREIPVCCEPSARTFAAAVYGCDLFISCDSGPMHLACALGVRTVGIFLLRHNFERWAPPPTLARIVTQGEGRCLREDLLEACRLELQCFWDSKPSITA